MKARRLVVALGLLAVGGCSQVAAIAPVGGNRLAEVRFAALDELTKAQVDILTAPVCSMTDTRDVTCTGATLDGEPIMVSSASPDQAAMTVKVGDRVIYSGAVQDALDAAARPTS